MKLMHYTLIFRLNIIKSRRFKTRGPYTKAVCHRMERVALTSSIRQCFPLRTGHARPLVIAQRDYLIPLCR